MCVSTDNMTFICNTCGTRMGMTPERQRMYMDRAAQVVDDVARPSIIQEKAVLPGTQNLTENTIDMPAEKVMEKRARLYKNKTQS